MCENLERETDLNSLRSNGRHSVAAPLRGRIDTTTLFWIFLMCENLERETRFANWPTLGRGTTKGSHRYNYIILDFLDV